MLSIDPPATAGGTDSVQERFQTFEAKPSGDNRDEKKYFSIVTRSVFALWQCRYFRSPGEAGANAYRGLLVRQLSVQHSEGREPSRLRTKTEGN